MNHQPTRESPIPDKPIANETKVVIVRSRHPAIEADDKGIVVRHLPGWGYGVAIKKYYPSALPAMKGTTTTRIICFLYDEVKEQDWKDEE